MTIEQRKMLTILRGCTFLPGSYDKRFVRNISALPDDCELTENQAMLIPVLFHRYRRQHGKCRCQECRKQ